MPALLMNARVSSYLTIGVRPQARIIFQASPYFFSDSPKGRYYCIASSAIFLIVVLGWFAYQALWFLGYVQALPLGLATSC